MAMPLSLADLLDRAWERLGRVVGYYADEEIVLNGLNPAQNLLVLLDPMLLHKRALVSLIAKETFIDLRMAAPRCLAVQRIVIGDVTADDATRSQGLGGQLNACTREQLRWQRNWWKLEGTPRMWYVHGRHLVGLHPRTAVPLILTLIHTAIPAPFSLAFPQSMSELATNLHPMLADIGAVLVLVKEGQVEASRAMQLLGEWVGEEVLTPLKRALAKLERDSLMHKQIAASPAQPVPQVQAPQPVQAGQAAV